jgi:biopolymer transport protein ExbD
MAMRRPEQLAWLGAQLASTAPLGYEHRGPVDTSIRLPKPAPGDLALPNPSAEPDKSLVVMLAADGALSVDGKPVDTADFEAALDRATQAAPGSSLGMILQADSTVPYAQVVAVMERAKAAGVERISIAVEPRPDVNVPAAPEDPLP